MNLKLIIARKFRKWPESGDIRDLDEVVKNPIPEEIVQ